MSVSNYFYSLTYTIRHLVDEMIGSDLAYYVVGFQSLAGLNSNICYLIWYYLMLLLHFNNSLLIGYLSSSQRFNSTVESWARSGSSQSCQNLSQIILIPSLTPSHMVDEIIASDPAYYVVEFQSLAGWNSNFCYLTLYYLMLLQ